MCGAQSHRRPTFTRSSSSSSSSSSSQNDRYDRSISTFSTDGRLLQVEYSTNASNRGKVMVAALELDFSSLLSSSEEEKKKNAVVVVMLKDINTNQEEEEEEEEGESLQLLKEETNQIKIHRISPSTLLYTTGLKGDGRTLATALRYHTANAKLQNGEEPSIQEIAEALGKIQHELTWTAGARPLGITATLVGVDEYDGKVKLYQCDPGGVVHPYSSCVAGGGGGSGNNEVDRSSILNGLLHLCNDWDKRIQQRLDDKKSEYKGKNGDDNDEKEEDNTLFCQNLCTEMVQKVGHVVLDAASSLSTTFFSHGDDDDDHDEEEKIQKKKKKKRCKIDLWVIQPAASESSLSEGRTRANGSGNALIRYATDVTKDDLVLVSKRMFA